MDHYAKTNSCLDEFRHLYTFQGTFELLKGASIHLTLAQNGVPDGYGVYVIYSVKADSKNLIYVGKAGTLTTSGIWKRQGLSGRLKRKQNKLLRQDFFQQFIEQHELDVLFFEWFVTFDGEQAKTLPLLAEARLLQAYFDDHNHLPSLNKQA